MLRPTPANTSPSQSPSHGSPRRASRRAPCEARSSALIDSSPTSVRTCAGGCEIATTRQTCAWARSRQQANAAGVGRGGAIPQARGKVYRIVLHEYRDEASRKLRAVDDLIEAEGRWHRWYRRRKRRPVPALGLDDEGAAILRRWREAAEVDPSRAEDEPCLAELERAAA
jgi:hypothetical protein